MALKYGQISQSQTINDIIYRCFEELEEGEQQKFVSKFKHHLQNPVQAMHTLRELVLGAYLHTLGFQARHELKLLGKTPDWAIVDDDGKPYGVVELVNLHIDRETEREIQERSRKKPSVVGYWVDGKKDNLVRLYDRLQKKADVYQELVDMLGLAYIIAFFGSFELALDAGDVMACLEGGKGQLFDQHPHVSGVLFFEENGGRYKFEYFDSPVAMRKLGIASGVFPE